MVNKVLYISWSKIYIPHAPVFNAAIGDEPVEIPQRC